MCGLNTASSSSFSAITTRTEEVKLLLYLSDAIAVYSIRLLKGLCYLKMAVRLASMMSVFVIVYCIRIVFMLVVAKALLCLTVLAACLGIGKA